MSCNRRNPTHATFGQAWIESRYWGDILEWIRLAEVEAVRLFNARADAYKRLLVERGMPTLPAPSAGLAEPARLSADVQRGTQPPTPEDQ